MHFIIHDDVWMIYSISKIFTSIILSRTLIHLNLRMTERFFKQIKNPKQKYKIAEVYLLFTISNKCNYNSTS